MKTLRHGTFLPFAHPHLIYSLAFLFYSFLLPESPDLSHSLAPITEERASRTLYRISLLSRLRELVLPHPSLEEHLALAQPSSDLPNWWSTPQHDHELLLGAASCGVSRTEHSIFSDSRFSFIQAHHEYVQKQQACLAAQTLTHSLPQQGDNVKEVKIGDKNENLESICSSAFPAIPFSHSEGKSREQVGWCWNKIRGGGHREGGKKGETDGGPSDSDSDSDSESSTSSHRSPISDVSGDSDAERDEQGEMCVCGVCFFLNVADIAVF